MGLSAKLEEGVPEGELSRRGGWGWRVGKVARRADEQHGEDTNEEIDCGGGGGGLDFNGEDESDDDEMN